MIGNRYGRLVVIKQSIERNHRTSHWICQCDCGNTAIVRSDNLRRNKSCGCLQLEAVSKHGESRPQTSEYTAWINMLRRCNYINHPSYADYGGRGIKVCKRWDPEQGGSYENFLEDVGHKPQKDLSLERTDNNKGYSPDNVIWATMLEQSHNRRPRITVHRYPRIPKHWRLPKFPRT